MPPRQLIRSKRVQSIRNISQVEAQRLRNELQLKRSAVASEPNIVANAPGATEITLSLLHLQEQSADPANPSSGNAVIWMSDGTGSGSDGDVLIKVTVNGVTRSGVLFSFTSAGLIATGDEVLFPALMKPFDLEMIALGEASDVLLEIGLGELA